MNQNKDINKYYKIVSVPYFLLSVYSLICIIFGVGSNKNPIGIYVFMNDFYDLTVIFIFYFIWWSFISIFVFIVFLISINRFTKVMKVKDDDRYYYLKKLQKNALCISILTISFAFFASAYTKELSFMIIILLILLGVVFSNGYIFERVYIASEKVYVPEDAKIERKPLIFNTLVNIVLLILSILLIVLILQVNIGYTFELEKGTYSYQDLPQSWYVWQMICFPVYVFYCMKVIQNAAKFEINAKRRMMNYTIFISVVSGIIILIQSNIFLNSNDYTSYFSYFLENHLALVILHIVLFLIVNLHDAIHILINYYQNQRKLKKIQEKYYQNHIVEEDPGFNL